MGNLPPTTATLRVTRGGHSPGHKQGHRQDAGKPGHRAGHQQNTGRDTNGTPMGPRPRPGRGRDISRDTSRGIRSPACGGPPPNLRPLTRCSSARGPSVNALPTLPDCGGISPSNEAPFLHNYATLMADWTNLRGIGPKLVEIGCSAKRCPKNGARFGGRLSFWAKLGPTLAKTGQHHANYGFRPAVGT